MIRLGNIITTKEISQRVTKQAEKIKSWDNAGFATKTGQAVKTMGLYFESVYSPSTRNYVLFLLPDSSYRRNAFDALATLKPAQVTNWSVR